MPSKRLRRECPGYVIRAPRVVNTRALSGSALRRFIERDRREEAEELSWLRLANRSRLDQFAE